MPTQKWLARDFMGLTPAIDARRSDQFYAIGGRNFVFDSKGPKSSFGNELLLPQPFEDARFIQGIRIGLRGGDRVFNFVPQGIVEWSETLGTWRFLYLTPDTSTAPYRWTWGYLNELVYFCHPRTGIVVYDPESGVCASHDGPGVPAQAIAICVDNGRLVAIDPIFEYWSAPSNGMDFTPTLGGAGFQKISDRVSGFPIMVTSYTQGVLVWTTGGVMRSEFTGDSAVYRHRALNTAYRLVNPFCSQKVDDNTVVIVDERGLFQTKGEAPTPFAPLFNEFLIDYMRRLNLKINQNVRLEWDELQRLMYVSVSQSYANPIFELSFVLYPAIDKWGSFNEHHYGIFPVKIDSSERANDYYGFVDSNRQVRFWRDSGYREGTQTDDTVTLVTKTTQKPATLDQAGTTIILSSTVGFSAVPVSQYPRSGFYPRDGFAVMPAVTLGLNAKVLMGLLRFQELQESVDQMAEVLQISIGSVLTGDPDQPRVDFNLVPPGFDEDYNDLSGVEDFGIESMNYVNHKVRVIGTKDGNTTFVAQEPSIVSIHKGIRYYSCSVPGIWHILELGAVEPGERFHLQHFELTAAYAGKLA